MKKTIPLLYAGNI